mmetsp:Transcript_16428/g.38032  ORF Transcript_16428/g.38032 Transcript_16428/m.38032 type:complete len:135 (+) Transcript_16428:1172-1576(+)
MPMQTGRVSPCRQAALASDGAETNAAATAAADREKNRRREDDEAGSSATFSRISVVRANSSRTTDRWFFDEGDQDSTGERVETATAATTKRIRRSRVVALLVFAERMVSRKVFVEVCFAVRKLEESSEEKTVGR